MKPCQKLKKMIPLTQRNLGIGRNGWRSLCVATQNIARPASRKSTKSAKAEEVITYSIARDRR